MKRFFRLRLALFLSACVVMWLPLAGYAEPKDDYRRAQAAEKEGDYRTAIAIYEALVSQFPRDPKLRAALAQTRVRAREGASKGALEAKLKAVILPEVEFSDTDLDSVFVYLSQKCDELTGGKLVPNFIYKGTLDERKRPQITLRLANVPVSEVIRYVGELTSTVFAYEAHAVVGTPAHLTTAEPAGKPAQ